MFVHYDALRKAKLAALDQFHRVSSIHMDSMDRLMRFCNGTADLTMKTLRTYEMGAGVEPLNRIMLHVLEGQIHLADRAQADMVRLFEAHAHGVGALTRQVIGEASVFASPFVKHALDANESLVVAGESMVDAAGEANLRTIEYIDKMIEKNSPARRKAQPRRKTRG
jgi:hypothetical protein